MKTDIILAGVGGQGILSIAAVLGFAAMEDGLNVKQSEVHGMSQRGGAVQSHLRISDQPIFSDLISEGGADLILSVEPMESLRYLPFLSRDGWLITNKVPFVNIVNYPDTDKVNKAINELENRIMIDADQIAKDMCSPKSSNMVMLGAASFGTKLKTKSLENGIRKLFDRKGDEVIENNLIAFQKGRDIAMKIRESR